MPAMLGCVQNVIERVQCSEGMDPLLVDPYMMEIGNYCQSILHSLPLLEGMIVGGDLSLGGEPSHVVEPTKGRTQQGRCARRQPTSEMTLRVEDPAELPVVSEPTVLELQAKLPLEPQPELPPEPQPDLPPEPQPQLPPEPQPELPLEPQPELPPEPQLELSPEPQPDRQPPIRRIYTRRQ
ncbi:hypothetical protein H6P81_007311 [Aristolochia fimbriata]|uniref:Uncharacterized protein n=1 Tax=Aristolochia fimbriata TaxID=158543 RepID=A0AAV7F380_ARIFI|nr:hypothetical protein H6P81_007311 [Aristolochia fimbriata]